MLCSACSINKVCTVFALKKEQMPHIDIVISKCAYAISLPAAKTTSNKPVELPTDESSTVFASSFDEEEYKRFLDRQQNTNTTKEKDIIVTCDTCGGTGYSSDISVCSRCGKQVCANCATSSDGLVYCEKCWEEV